MNAIPRLSELLASHNVWELYRTDTPLFLATPAHTLLALDVADAIPHTDAPLAARVNDALRRARAEGQAGAAVVGAVPFDVDAPAALRVARTLLRARPLDVPQVPEPVGTRYATRELPSADVYADAVARAVASIRAGELDKVVLARTLEVTGERPVDVATLVARLASRNPRGYTFSVDLGAGRTLLGASPELLVNRFGRIVRANPLAGSAPRSRDPVEDERRARALLASAKDLAEHRVVVDAVRDGLAPLCRRLEVPERPSLIQTETMWHLSTEVRGETDADALTLALALHPTPAVCGAPRAAARDIIRDAEPFDRGFYAGMLGWVDTHGDGEWVVTIRCAEAFDRTLRLYAGAGVVGESTPEGERAETAAKFRTMLDALGIDRVAASDAAREAA
ncbi:isochorismate synthase [Burkholderia multivorans]|uniref:isochorismate synthase n=1 Tax=Burkholderia multivorans TaxID=87883 RepID=UPI00057FC320|nr:isochorismate synthase [Burkholderia multivorans]KHS14119.1 isochorismate synthase [Burkholderia multivorans]KHS17204.1 isochorismate synthase [Burkholderia multivorans]MBR7924335.1 isochorismate synthase [Burkholderia multivorans]MBR8103254.1 isochorismate synthase [Burkholderia multivorans]MBR8337184.1 isochorismate synthase [Burkholderia multivorans]